MRGSKLLTVHLVVINKLQSNSTPKFVFFLCGKAISPPMLYKRAHLKDTSVLGGKGSSLSSSILPYLFWLCILWLAQSGQERCDLCLDSRILGRLYLVDGYNNNVKAFVLRVSCMSQSLISNGRSHRSFASILFCQALCAPAIIISFYLFSALDWSHFAFSNFMPYLQPSDLSSSDLEVEPELGVTEIKNPSHHHMLCL